MQHDVRRSIVHLAVAASVAAGVALAAEAPTSSGYRLPPPEVVEILTAEPAPRVGLSPDHRFMTWTRREAMPSIADVSRRMLRLAGVRIDPASNGRFRTSYDRGFELRRVDGGELVRRIELAPDEGLADLRWSHTAKALAWVVVSPAGSHLHTMRVEPLEAPRRHTRPLNTVMDGIAWMPDGETLLVQLVPAGRGDEPPPPRVPTGPSVQESSGNTSPTRTYQDLLSSAHDEALFEHYATGRLALVGLDGTLTTVGEPGIMEASASPDGSRLLVERIRRPYSYLLGYWGFPSTIEVVDRDGRVRRTVAEVPPAENIPIGGVRTGPRRVEWLGGRSATLVWAEALDGGDPKREVPHRDRLLTLDAHDDAPPRRLVEIEHRYRGIRHLADGRRVITSEYDRDRRWWRTLLHDPERGGEPRVLTDRSIRDRYGDPGSLVTVPDDTGRPVPLQHGDWVYRTGRGASPDGELPFVDRQHLKTLETERLWRSEPGSFEVVVDVLRGGPRRKPIVITSHETPTSPPNYRVRDLERGTTTALTAFPDPTPQIRGITKRLVTYERADGVPLSATLYLPAGHEPGERLPLLVWAYPREFNDVTTAGQVGASPSRFTRIRGSSHLALVTQGYAIMDGATMPVIGDPETMNDTFVEQIVGAAKAAIDTAVELGAADRDRVAVGGHSYGAFMTANLLAHSDLFRAGVARSGAYNRTLTPFGFQSERRPLWEAKPVYFGISPFMHADRIQEPLLLIHGEKDNNSGTFPMQSRRLFQAIKGNGGTVRLVMLPEESHGYRARESVLHVQAETIEWFERFVKSPPDQGASSSSSSSVRSSLRAQRFE